MTHFLLWGVHCAVGALSTQPMPFNYPLHYHAHMGSPQLSQNQSPTDAGSPKWMCNGDSRGCASQQWVDAAKSGPIKEKPLSLPHVGSMAEQLAVKEAGRHKTAQLLRDAHLRILGPGEALVKPRPVLGSEKP